jgi:hypothetical protein
MMEKRDLLDELKSAFEFADAILGLAEDSEPIRCLAYAVAEKLGILIEELEAEDKRYIVKKDHITPEQWEALKESLKFDRFSVICENKYD